MFALAYLLSTLIFVFILIIIVQVAISWLIAFNVINIENEQARNLVALLKRATDPIYTPIRKYIPPVGGIDLTPLIVIIGLQLIDHLVIWRLFYGSLVHY
jgi:YggT family protein